MNFEFIGNYLQRVHHFKSNGYRVIDISLQITTFKRISAPKNSRYIYIKCMGASFVTKSPLSVSYLCMVFILF